ncbi:hypothetical protein [Aeromonas allosaccharophila]|uniref:hypothetical protein n=1 Tax=Aeromonas allosaccharophila TaxID=656 RepID=UPI000DCF7E3E|nr:hypothetical protein [Aeromonas allosaccharophila]
MKKITIMILSALAVISVQARERLNHENAKDYKQDLYLINKAAEQGNANAQYDLGLMYFDGRARIQLRSATLAYAA